MYSVCSAAKVVGIVNLDEPRTGNDSADEAAVRRMSRDECVESRTFWPAVCQAERALGIRGQRFMENRLFLPGRLDQKNHGNWLHQ